MNIQNAVFLSCVKYDLGRSKHWYSNFPSEKDAATQVNGDTKLGTDELEAMAVSDSDANMEDIETDWSLSLGESDEDSFNGDTKFIVNKSSLEELLPNSCLHCANRLQDTDVVWRVLGISVWKVEKKF